MKLEIEISNQFLLEKVVFLLFIVVGKLLFSLGLFCLVVKTSILLRVV
ncbi:hypothetical protein GCM10007384_35240 [Aquimarina muelleri]|uniref:Uncharacterized protein n=1 Tax=Aquimarina muelleri TaxID=279356 RepID=A0A918N5L0_9FLAO|nr:hypothetical protein GCM10007384_35240 [Aquimarina muelleri]